MTSTTEQRTTEQRTPAAPQSWILRLVRWTELMLPTMTEIRVRRPIAQPLLLGWLLSLLTAWMAVPLVTTALPDDAAGGVRVVQGLMWGMAAASPLLQSGRSLLWAAGAWALLTLASREVSRRRLFSIFLYGETLRAAYGLLLVLFFQWTVAPGAAGLLLTDPLSLAAYVPSDHGFFGGLVKHSSLVQAGWVAFVGLAGVRVLRLSPRGAWALALTLWLGLVVVATARVLVNG